MKQGCRSIVFKYADLLGYDTDCTVFVKALEGAACKRLELAISCLRSYFLTSHFYICVWRQTWLSYQCYSVL